MHGRFHRARAGPQRLGGPGGIKTMSARDAHGVNGVGRRRKEKRGNKNVRHSQRGSRRRDPLSCRSGGRRRRCHQAVRVVQNGAHEEDMKTMGQTKTRMDGKTARTIISSPYEDDMVELSLQGGGALLQKRMEGLRECSTAGGRRARRRRTTGRGRRRS